MNNKGFTLVELLTAITILVLLGFLATSTITNVVRSSKNDLYDAQIELIRATAETWGSENLDKLPNEDECKYITVNNLIKYGLFEDEIINPKTNKPFPSNMKIKITSTITNAGKLKTTYEVGSKNISGCDNVYPPVCTLVSGNEKEIGSKYECEVKPGAKYNFYVLSGENDGSINLIMERNICEDGTLAAEDNKCLVAWMSDSTYGCGADGSSCAQPDKGPVTAMNYLRNATKDWTNISNIIMDYTDENVLYSTHEKGTDGYGSIKTIKDVTTITAKNGNVIATYTKLKARLPKDSEVHESGKCLTYAENGSKYGSCPLWLVDYLNTSSYYTEGKTNLSGIYGYWTLSSGANSSHIAWGIYYNGYANYDNVYNGSTSGIRPVINIRL